MYLPSAKATLIGATAVAIVGFLNIGISPVSSRFGLMWNINAGVINLPFNLSLPYRWLLTVCVLMAGARLAFGKRTGGRRQDSPPTPGEDLLGIRPLTIEGRQELRRVMIEAHASLEDEFRKSDLKGVANGYRFPVLGGLAVTILVVSFCALRFAGNIVPALTAAFVGTAATIGLGYEREVAKSLGRGWRRLPEWLRGQLMLAGYFVVPVVVLSVFAAGKIDWPAGAERLAVGWFILGLVAAVYSWRSRRDRAD